MKIDFIIAKFHFVKKKKKHWDQISQIMGEIGGNLFPVFCFMTLLSSAWQVCKMVVHKVTAITKDNHKHTLMPRYKFLT